METAHPERRPHMKWDKAGTKKKEDPNEKVIIILVSDFQSSKFIEVLEK